MVGRTEHVKHRRQSQSLVHLTRAVCPVTPLAQTYQTSPQHSGYGTRREVSKCPARPSSPSSSAWASRWSSSSPSSSRATPRAPRRPSASQTRSAASVSRYASHPLKAFSAAADFFFFRGFAPRSVNLIVYARMRAAVHRTSKFSTPEAAGAGIKGLRKSTRATCGCAACPLCVC